MNEEYTLIPADEVKHITFIFLEEDNLLPRKIKKPTSFKPYSYKYIIRENPFIENLVNLEIIFYLGTQNFPRRSSGKLESHIFTIQFKTTVQDKSLLKSMMWDYIYSFEDISVDKLKEISYKTTYVTVSHDSYDEVSDMFGIMIII